MLKGVPAGKPVRLTWNEIVPLVMLPAASLVTLNVIVAVPLPLASALDTGGTSFAGDSAAVNTGLTGVDGSVDDLPQATEPMAKMAARTARRFIVPLLLIRR